MSDIETDGGRDEDWYRDPPKAKRGPRLVQSGADPLSEAKEGIKDLLLRTSTGSPRKVIANATTILALDPRWHGALAYQALSDRVVKLKAPEWHEHDRPAKSELGQWTDVDTTRCQAWLSREYSLDLGADIVNAVIQTTAERNWIDPLKDYFTAVDGIWDGTPRIDTWLTSVFSAPDTPYARAIGRRWLISAVARALRPGCKVDHVLVLEGLQGKKKSTALEMLCPSSDLFFDSELAIGDKDAIQVLRGKWIIELGEVPKLNKDLNTLKAFITRKVDTIRPSFGRRAIDMPRRFVFSASTNEDDYLKDPTGNRRWWPIEVYGPVNLDWIVAHRDQMWSEALAALKQGDPWWLETEELTALALEEQGDREEVHPWEEKIGEYLSKALRASPIDAVHTERCQCVRCAGVTVGGILAGAMGVEWGKQGKVEQGTVGRILRGLGWVKGKQARRDAGRVKPFYPPAEPPPIG